MPVKTPRRHHTNTPSRHHKQTKIYLKPYWPYLPMLLIIIVGLVLGSPRISTNRPKGVLAFATNTSTDGLLSATNSQRTSNGKSTLGLNSLLEKAAQNKANDMVARNYWSHNTPDGQEPWIFIQNVGYKYSKAGENLAYGFTTSDDTITGWMNSPTHKANLLDPNFNEVGFGIANSNDYNQSGPETLVVAMYGQPQVLGTNTTQPNVQAAKKSPVTSAPTTKQTPPPQVTTPAKVATPVTVNSSTPIIEPASQQISKVQTITRGKVPWIGFALGILSAVAILVMLIRHSLSFRRIIKDSEKFIMHHPLFDTIMVFIIMAAYVLNRTTGIIK